MNRSIRKAFRFGTPAARIVLVQAIACALGITALLPLQAGWAAEDEISWDAPERVPIDALEKLFAGSDVGKYPALTGIYNLFTEVNEDHELARMTFLRTRLRGRLALIPVEASRILRLTERLAAVAFPIYLCNVCKGDEIPKSLYAEVGVHVAYRRHHGGEFGTKLFQVGLVDTRSWKFLAKPSGYPLESPNWDPLRDSGPLRDLDLEIMPVDGCGACIEIRYRIGADSATRRDYLQIFALTGSGTYTSERFEYGTVAGSGNSAARVEYRTIRRSGQRVIATKERIVDRQKTSEPAILLELPREPEQAWEYGGN